MKDEGIVRNRLRSKPASAMRRPIWPFRDFSAYLWSFIDGKPVQNPFRSRKQVPATTPLAEKISKDLKKRGFRFAGRPSSMPSCRPAAW